MDDRMRNRGSALLMTLLWAGILSICSLMMFTSGMIQLKLQRRILMQENNFCYLEQRMEKLQTVVGDLTDEAAKECGEKALREAARAAREKAEEEAKAAANEAVEEGKSTDAVAGEDEIDMKLARELYRERIFRKLKRSLRSKELEKMLMKGTASETSFGTMSEAGREIATDAATEISVTVESVAWDRNTILVKGLCLSGSAPGSRIRSSVSADLRISIPELEYEADSEHETDSEYEVDSERETNAAREEVSECGTSSEAKSSSSETASESEFYSQATLEHFRREKRRFRK